MRFQDILALAATLATAVSAIAVPDSLVLHEKRHAAPRKWVKRDAMPAKSMLPMRIGLKQSNLHRGDDLLMEVSHPDSPRYGQWYSPEEIVDIFAPSNAAVDAVKSWLEGAGVAAHRVSQSANKQWIQFDAFVHEAEELLKTKYHVYEHVASGKTHVACDEYHVPARIQEHIDYVTPGIKLMAGGKAVTVGAKEKRTDPIEKRGFRTSASSPFSGPIFGLELAKDAIPTSLTGQLSKCDTIVTPACIAQFYNISKATLAAKGNELGIFEEGDFYAAEDLIEFFALVAPNIPPTTTPKLEGINGGSAPGVYAGGESDLDFQISYPIICKSS